MNVNNCRISALLLALVMLISLSGCKATPEHSGADISLPAEQPSAQEESAEAPQDPADQSAEELPELQQEPEAELPSVEVPVVEELRPAADYDEIYRLMLSVQEDVNAVFSMNDQSGPQDMLSEEILINPVAEQYGDPLYPNADFSGIQQEGLSVTEGNRIYMVSTGELIILKADGADTVELGRSFVINPAPEGYSGSEIPQAVYVMDDSVLIVTYEYLYRNYTAESDESVYESIERVHVKRYDVSDPSAPQIMSDFAQSGRYLNSWLSDGELYLIGAHSIWMPDAEQPATFVPSLMHNGEDAVMEPGSVVLCPNLDSMDYTVISALDVSTGACLGSKAVTGYLAWSEREEDAFYLAGISYDFDISEPYQEAQYTVNDYAYRAYTRLIRMEMNSDLAITHDSAVDGALLDGDALSLSDGTIYLAVACSADSFHVYEDKSYGFVNVIPGEREFSNAVYALDTTLEIVNQMQGILQGTQLYKVRFDGATAYLLDYLDTIPDYAIDLSAAEWNAEALSLSVFAHHLYDLQEGFTVGTYVAEPGVLMLACFDAQLNLLAETQVSESWMQAMSAPASVKLFPEQSVIAVPAENAYFLYELEDGAFRLLGKAELGYTADTGIFCLDGYWYFCNDAAITVLDDSFETVQKSEFAYG